MQFFVGFLSGREHPHHVLNAPFGRRSDRSGKAVEHDGELLGDMRTRGVPVSRFAYGPLGKAGCHTLRPSHHKFAATARSKRSVQHNGYLQSRMSSSIRKPCSLQTAGCPMNENTDFVGLRRSTDGAVTRPGGVPGATVRPTKLLEILAPGVVAMVNRVAIEQEQLDAAVKASGQRDTTALREWLTQRLIAREVLRQHAENEGYGHRLPTWACYRERFAAGSVRAGKPAWLPVARRCPAPMARCGPYQAWSLVTQ
ncbi:hypothetical protein QFZ97_001168 [Paraburkholderia youngii]